MLSELSKKRWFCAHLCSVCLALGRFSVRSPLVSSEVDYVRLCAKIDYVHLWRVEEIQRICQRCEALTCSGAALTLESFLSAFPSCKCKWIYSISKDSPASAPPRDPTAGSCYPCDPPFWPETPSITIYPFLCVVFQLNLHLWSWTASSSACWGRFPCPGTPPGSPALRAKMVKATSFEGFRNDLDEKTFWIVLGFILKENLNPRVLYVLMIKHTKCQISWEVDSSCLFND